MLGIALSLPAVQTKLAQYVTNTINKDYGTNIAIDKIAISIFGGVKMKNVLILDHHKDTLIYANRIKTGATELLDFAKLKNDSLVFTAISLDKVLFNLKTYKSEKLTNIDVFINAFGTEKSTGNPFLLTSKSVKITNSHFLLIDENRENPKDVDFAKFNTNLSNFKLYGPNVNTIINKMSFLDHRGLYVANLSAIFSYTKKQIKMKHLDLLTKESKLKGDIALNYKIEDFSNFTNKVQFDVEIKSSSLASNDIRCFYNELGKNLHFNAKAKIKGTLNDLYLKNLKLYDSKNSKIIGDINFKNLFPKKDQEFFMAGKLKQVTTSYNDLVVILPNVLGKKLPVILNKLGKINLVGNTELTTTNIKAIFDMKTALGNANSNLVILDMDKSDKAKYKGNIILDKFNLGNLFDRKDLTNVTVNLDVDGKGFSEKHLNTSVKGKVSQIDFNKYNYTNISLDGNFKLPLYKGKLSVNDPNLKMTFDGLLDLSKKESKYDFHIVVAKSDLHKLNFTTEKVSSFKGNIIVQATGNSIDNLQGNVYINETMYQNTKSTYLFDNFSINSNFDANRVRTITINSPDIAEGEIVGKFQFSQLKDLVTNSLGSLYTNYKPSKVKKGQFLKFDFTVYNKIVEIFYPEILIGPNTNIKGTINSDNKDFKLKFNSPKITYSDNSFDNIRVAVDNKNPLFNTFIELDSIKTKYYKMRDFSLINVTMKDTLRVRTEFKGGSKGEDYFNLDLFHTINADNKNVIGISKSEINLKDYIWFLNEKGTQNNQIVFDKALKNFKIDDVILSHESQSIELKGDISGLNKIDLNLNLKDVDLNKVTPTNPQFVFEGNINGNVNFKKDNEVYQPTANVVVDHLKINKTDLGYLNLEISSDESFKKFNINSTLQNSNLESFNAKGNLEIVDNETILDLNLKFDKFNLALLSPIGGEVISNIRGFVSGNSTVQGNVNKPDINGRLYVDKAGMSIPYLNVDYELGDKTIIDLTEEKFLFRNNTLTDTKYKTKGVLNGIVEHSNFSDWKLDLALDSRRLIALDTKDSDDAAYFGTAFMDGSVSIKGPTDALLIKVVANSEKGTAIKIPINSAESVGDNSFIHFTTEKEKFNLKKGIVGNTKNIKGLELEFDFDISPNAEVEVILDRNSGHGMKGKGYGNLSFRINTTGKFEMRGDFLPFEGTYNFKYGGLIDKKFVLRKGGSIEWAGNPMKAILNLEAVYKTSANPGVLLENSSLNSKVPVEVVIGIRGDLASPEPNFNIEFPTVTNVLKSEIEYILNDKEIRDKQALSLLAFGSFLSPDGVGQFDLSGSLVETATSMLDGILGVENEKFKVGLNVVTADKRVGSESDGRFVATISSKINDRITINGKVGVPFGGVNESAIVGNIEILYRVNEDGTMNLRLFNKENDINYIGQGIGYTQGVGISYEVDFDTFKELANKIFKKIKIDKEIKYEGFDQDSNLPPENKEEPKPKKDSDKKINKNQEGLVPEED